MTIQGWAEHFMDHDAAPPSPTVINEQSMRQQIETLEQIVYGLEQKVTHLERRLAKLERPWLERITEPYSLRRFRGK